MVSKRNNRITLKKLANVHGKLNSNQVESLNHLRDVLHYKQVIPDEEISELVRQRYVKQGFGGYMLTDEGNDMLQKHEISQERIMS